MSCCYKPGSTRWRTGDGGRRVLRKRLNGGRDRTAGFLMLVRKGFLFKIKKEGFHNVIQEQCLLRVRTSVLVEIHQMRTFGPIMWVWLPYYYRLTRDASKSVSVANH